METARSEVSHGRDPCVVVEGITRSSRSLGECGGGYRVVLVRETNFIGGGNIDEIRINEEWVPSQAPAPDAAEPV
jgi:hypothetical protein